MTDGRFTYLHPWYGGRTAKCYSTMFINPCDWFSPVRVSSHPVGGRFLPYAEAPVWRYATSSRPPHDEPLLFDLLSDPEQNVDLAGRALHDERRMRELLAQALHEMQAPSARPEEVGD